MSYVDEEHKALVLLEDDWQVAELKDNTKLSVSRKELRE